MDDISARTQLFKYLQDNHYHIHTRRKILSHVGSSEKDIASQALSIVKETQDEEEALSKILEL